MTVITKVMFFFARRGRCEIVEEEAERTEMYLIGPESKRSVRWLRHQFFDV